MNCFRKVVLVLCFLSLISVGWSSYKLQDQTKRIVTDLAEAKWFTKLSKKVKNRFPPCRGKYDGYILSVISNDLKQVFQTRYCYTQELRTAIIRNASTGCLFVPYGSGERPKKPNQRKGHCLGENGKWYNRNQIISIGVSKEDNTTLPKHGEVRLVEYCGDQSSSCCQSVLKSQEDQAGYCEVFTVSTEYLGFNLLHSRIMHQSFERFFGNISSETLLKMCVHYLKNTSVSQSHQHRRWPEADEEASTATTTASADIWRSKRSTVCMFSACLDIIWMG